MLLGTSKFWRSISIVINERSSTDQIRTFLRDRLRLAGSRRVSFDLTQHDSNLGPLDYLPSILDALKERPVLFTQYYENFQHMEGIFIHIYRTIKPQPFQFLKALRLQGPDMTMHSKGNFHLPYLEVLDIEAWTYLLELLGLFRTENLNTLIFTGYSDFDLGQFMQCLQSFPTLVYLIQSAFVWPSASEDPRDTIVPHPGIKHITVLDSKGMSLVRSINRTFFNVTSLTMTCDNLIRIRGGNLLSRITELRLVHCDNDQSNHITPQTAFPRLLDIWLSIVRELTNLIFLGISMRNSSKDDLNIQGDLITHRGDVFYKTFHFPTLDDYPICDEHMGLIADSLWPALDKEEVVSPLLETLHLSDRISLKNFLIIIKAFRMRYCSSRTKSCHATFSNLVVYNPTNAQEIRAPDLCNVSFKELINDPKVAHLLLYLGSSLSDVPLDPGLALECEEGTYSLDD